MPATKPTSPSRIIATLNALHLGERDSILSRLADARRACLELDQEELARVLEEAALALGRADLKTYRRRVETVIARLGHLR